MDVTITAIDPATADALRADVAAGRLPAQRRTLTEADAPCRQCLQLGEPGEEMLLLTYQPFRGASPYAVPSPIFLHARPCATYDERDLPAFVRDGGPRAVRSYDDEHAIVDGAVADAGNVMATIGMLLHHDRAAYVHVHCAVNGCFTFRADRA